MSTDSEIRVLYSVDGYVEIYSIWLLIGKAFKDELYVICHDYDQTIKYPSIVTVKFCLLVNRGVEDDLTRLAPVFICSFKQEGVVAITECLKSGCPVPTELLLQNLDVEESFKYHEEVLWGMQIAYLQNKSLKEDNLNVGRTALSCLALQNEDRIIAVFRRIYNVFINPFWFVSKFGPSEKGLVIAMRYYLIEYTFNDLKNDLDLQSIKDFLLTFDFQYETNKSDILVSDIMTFAKLSKFYCNSCYVINNATKDFVDYVNIKLSHDAQQFDNMQCMIDKYRGSLKTSNGEFVSYLYLSHFECFKKSMLWTHLNATRFSNIKNFPKEGIAKKVQESFFQHLHEQFNISSYIKNNIKIQLKEIPNIISQQYLRGLTYSCTSNQQVMVTGTKSEWLDKFQHLQNTLNHTGYILTNATKNHCQDEQKESFTDILLSLAAARAIVSSGGATPRDVLMGCKLEGASPVFRTVSMNNQHLFLIIGSEDWLSSALGDYSLPDEWTLHQKQEELDYELTNASYFPSEVFAKLETESQSYLNRNELFNDKLAVVNLIFDLDFKIKEQIPLRLLYQVMRCMRICLLELLDNLCTPDWKLGAHPIYFYKTACPLLECEDDSFAQNNIDKPCNCVDKLGFRMICPLPSPFCLLGESNMIEIATLFQQAALMNIELMTKLDTFLCNFEFVDVQVYRKGRSLRTPFSYKISQEGFLSGRLLPFFIVPEDCVDIKGFMYDHLNSKNFSFHALPELNNSPNIFLHSLKGTSENYISKKADINRNTYFPKKSTISSLLTYYKADYESDDAVIDFLETVVLEKVKHFIGCHYPDKLGEYCSVYLTCVKKCDCYCLCSLNASKYGGQFTCMRFKHNRNSRTTKVYLALSVTTHNRLCVSFQTQCFATKCGSNTLQTVFTLDI